jgi:hypothetical protein
MNIMKEGRKEFKLIFVLDLGSGSVSIGLLCFSCTCQSFLIS